MSISYSYANLTKQEWFSADAYGGTGRYRDLGFSLASRAFERLLVRYDGPQRAQNPIAFGRWADDSIAIVTDSDDKWLEYYDRFADLYADLIPLINSGDGFDGLGAAAEHDDRLYAQICHLIFSRQALELEQGMRDRFGPKFRERYNEIYPKLTPGYRPRDLRGTKSG